MTTSQPPSRDRDLLIGTTLGDGRYQVLRPLGQGGMATVYRARQTGLSRDVAIKMIEPGLADESAFRARFRREAIAAANLRHPHILAVVDYGEEDGVPYLVTELLDGGRLAERRGDAPLTVPEVVALLRPIGDALDYAHARGMLHRDVKPTNVLFDRDGRAVLADFGLVALFDAASADPALPETLIARPTTTGAFVGTPAYMAPEQGMGRAGTATDRYALGVIAYELLTGALPYTGATPYAVMRAHESEPLPGPRTRNPALPAAVETVLQRALAKRPEDRYASAASFMAALESTAAPAPPASAARSLPSFRTLIATAALVVVAAATAFLALQPRSQAQIVAPTPLPAPIIAPSATAPAPPTQTPVPATAVPTAATAATTALGWEVVTALDVADGTAYGIATDRHGNIFVVQDLIGSGRVRKFSPAGQPLASWSGGRGEEPGQFLFTHSLAVDDQDNLYLADTGNARIQKLAADGTLLAEWDGFGPVFIVNGVPVSVEPRSLVVDGPGNVYVTDPRNGAVQKLSPDGRIVAEWGTRGSGPGQFGARPIGTPSPARLLPSTATDLGSGPKGLALDRHGNVYVADTGNDRIQKFSPNGEPLAQWGSRGTGPGQFDLPRSLAVDAAGFIYVADTFNRRVQKLAPDGKPLDMWTGSEDEKAAAPFIGAPTALTVDAADNLFVAWGSRILKLPESARP
jgi:sugar lactone lactonase YvrE